jgi:hypothetical protein
VCLLCEGSPDDSAVTRPTAHTLIPRDYILMLWCESCVRQVPLTVCCFLGNLRQGCCIPSAEMLASTLWTFGVLFVHS